MKIKQTSRIVRIAVVSFVVLAALGSMVAARKHQQTERNPYACYDLSVNPLTVFDQIRVTANW
jgi:hypothetical protein